MKTLNYIFLGVMMALFACSPENHQGIDPNNLPSVSDLDVEITVGEKNVVTFDLVNQGVNPVWIFGEGDIQTVDGYTRSYLFEGTYEVEVKAFNHNGYSDGSVVKSFTVEESYLPEQYYFLAGEDLSGKSWVFDQANNGWYMADPGNAYTTWWNPPSGGVVPADDWNGKMVFDIINEGTMTHWNDASGSSDASSHYSFNADFTEITFTGDANILGSGKNTNGEDQAVNNGIFQIVELTADKMMLFNPATNGGTGWVWIFVPEE
ncbi:MAG: hypothetical protein ACK5IJ_10065 [Mangrovibacterium sp.]